MKTLSKSYTLIGLMLFCCSTREDLNIGDLRFVEIERQAIRENQIQRTLVKYHFSEGTQMDTIMYDTLGRITFESHPTYKMTVMYDDRIGLEVLKEIVEGSQTIYDSANYKYEPDSLLLYQFWSYDSYYYKYHFDKKGLVTEITSYNKANNLSPSTLSRISYDGDRPVRNELLMRRGKELAPTANINYYYSGTKLDSVIQTSVDQKIVKTVYDENGLVRAVYYGGELHQTFDHERRMN